MKQLLLSMSILLLLVGAVTASSVQCEIVSIVDDPDPQVDGADPVISIVDDPDPVSHCIKPLPVKTEE